MTTINGLARHYHLLTPAERLSLIHRAVDRGDEAEADRLAAAAPRVTLTFPDHYGRGEGVLFATLCYAGDLLHLSLYYWQASGLMESRAALGEEDDELQDRLWGAVRLAAYLIVTHAAGWRLWAEESGLDADGLLADLPWVGSLREAEKAAAAIAFTEAEAREWILARFPDAGRERKEILTAAKVAAGVHQLVEMRAREWESP